MGRPEFDALSREAGIAAAAIGQGIHGISNATYAEKGYYHFAFFNLSIAFERIAKLVVILDRLRATGNYPTDAQLRRLGHRLGDLFLTVEAIRGSHHQAAEAVPSDPITAGIVATLSDFATSTRYYNLDYLVGGRSAGMQEPIAAWHASVGLPILEKYYSARKRREDEEQARLLGGLMDQFTLVAHTAEDGSPITSWTDGAMATAKIKVLQRYGRMYCLRIVRALTSTLGAVQVEALRAGHDVPYLTEFFRIYSNDDRYFLSRKTWDPYKP